MEKVFSWVKVCVEGLTARPRIFPLLIPPLQLISEMHLLGDSETQGCVVDLNVPCMSRKSQGCRRRVALVIGYDFFDMHRRNQRIAREFCRGNHLKDAFICEPQFAVGRGGSRGREDGPSCLSTVQDIQGLNLKLWIRTAPRSFKLRTRDHRKAAGLRKPEVAILRHHRGVHQPAGKAISLIENP
jgi:hypothetical protein